MDRFLSLFGSEITGTLSCFDRVLFRGTMRLLSQPEGLFKWLCWEHVLLKDFGSFAKAQASVLKAHARATAEKEGRPYIYIETPSASKDKLIQRILARDKIQEGLVAVLACVEPSPAYDMGKNQRSGRLEPVRRWRKCLFLYFYFLDRDFGLMHVRLQTWFPFDVQVCINGHDWLARQMDRRRLTYVRRDNCFAALQDPAKAQTLADEMPHLPWKRLLDAFARRANPLLRGILKLQSYYWTIRQGEYATDIMFRSPQALAKVYPRFVHHAITTFHSEDIMRFLGQKLHPNFTGEVKSTLKRRPEGVRVRHSVRENSIKIYDKQGSVLRIETTINNPRRFKAYRRVLRNGTPVYAWMQMRKGIADLRRRVEISRAANLRYLNALASIPTARPACAILDPVSRPAVTPTRRFRPLRPWAADEALLFAGIMRGEFLLAGFRNADIRRHLHPGPVPDPETRRRQASAVSRRFRLLRAHHLIRKLPGTSRYLVNPHGVEVMSVALQMRTLDMALLKKTA